MRRPGTRRRALAAAVIFGLIWLFIWSTKLQWASTGESSLTTVLYALCVLPTILFIAGHRFRIPLMPMWGLGYFSMFGMPMLVQDKLMEFGLTTASAVMNAMQLVTLGAMACLLAFYTPLGKWVEALVPRIRAPWDRSRAPRIGILLSIVGVGFHYFELTSAVPAGLAQLLFIASQLAVVGMLTLFLLQLRGHLPFLLRLFLWGLIVPVEFLLGLGTGLVANVLMVMAPLIFCYAAERGRIPWKAMIIGTLLLIPFLGPAKQEYRSYAWGGEEGPAVITNSPLEKGMAFMELALKRATEGGMEAYTVASETTQARISYLNTFIAIMEMTPATIPFGNGESYTSFFWTLAPRILFPNKPTKTMGQEFGHRYHLLDEDDLTTSINFPHQVIEMYANFGIVGVALGMFIIGLAYRGIMNLLAHPEGNERGLIIGCALLANLLNLESDFSMIFGGVVYYILIMYLFVHSMGGRSEETTLTQDVGT